MWTSHLSRQTFALESHCYRLTDRGRACVEVVDTDETVGSLTRHLHDVLMLCGSALWFEQLRQFMPPRTLEESLRALLNLGLIEAIHPDHDDAPARPVAPAARYTRFPGGAMSAGWARA